MLYVWGDHLLLLQILSEITKNVFFLLCCFYCWVPEDSKTGLGKDGDLDRVDSRKRRIKISGRSFGRPLPGQSSETAKADKKIFGYKLSNCKAIKTWHFVISFIQNIYVISLVLLCILDID